MDNLELINKFEKLIKSTEYLKPCKVIQFNNTQVTVLLPDTQETLTVKNLNVNKLGDALLVYSTNGNYCLSELGRGETPSPTIINRRKNRTVEDTTSTGLEMYYLLSTVKEGKIESESNKQYIRCISQGFANVDGELNYVTNKYAFENIGLVSEIDLPHCFNSSQECFDFEIDYTDRDAIVSALLNGESVHAILDMPVYENSSDAQSSGTGFEMYKSIEGPWWDLEKYDLNKGTLITPYFPDGTVIQIHWDVGTPQESSSEPFTHNGGYLVAKTQNINNFGQSITRVYRAFSFNGVRIADGTNREGGDASSISAGISSHSKSSNLPDRGFGPRPAERFVYKCKAGGTSPTLTDAEKIYLGMVEPYISRTGSYASSGGYIGTGTGGSGIIGECRIWWENAAHYGERWYNNPELKWPTGGKPTICFKPPGGGRVCFTNEKSERGRLSDPTKINEYVVALSNYHVEVHLCSNKKKKSLLLTKLPLEDYLSLQSFEFNNSPFKKELHYKALSVNQSTGDLTASQETLKRTYGDYKPIWDLVIDSLQRESCEDGSPGLPFTIFWDLHKTYKPQGFYGREVPTNEFDEDSFLFKYLSKINIHRKARTFIDQLPLYSLDLIKDLQNTVHILRGKKSLLICVLLDLKNLSADGSYYFQFQKIKLIKVNLKNFKIKSSKIYNLDSELETVEQILSQYDKNYLSDFFKINRDVTKLVKYVNPYGGSRTGSAFNTGVNAKSVNLQEGYLITDLSQTTFNDSWNLDNFNILDSLNMIDFSEENEDFDSIINFIINYSIKFKITDSSSKTYYYQNNPVDYELLGYTTHLGFDTPNLANFLCLLNSSYNRNLYYRYLINYDKKLKKLYRITGLKSLENLTDITYNCTPESFRAYEFEKDLDYFYNNLFSKHLVNYLANKSVIINVTTSKPNYTPYSLEDYFYISQPNLGNTSSKGHTEITALHLDTLPPILFTDIDNLERDRQVILKKPSNLLIEPGWRRDFTWITHFYPIETFT
jgi:hypothetical protein